MNDSTDKVALCGNIYTFVIVLAWTPAASHGSQHIWEFKCAVLPVEKWLGNLALQKAKCWDAGCAGGRKHEQYFSILI